MSSNLMRLKHAAVGKPVSSDRVLRERLRKRFAVPSLSAESLSALAYAPDDMIATLAVAGLSAYALSPWVGLAVGLVMATIIVAHRNLIQEFPNGGGDFAVTKKWLGRRAGQVVGSSLLVDYVLTVAVATSQAAAFAAGAWPALAGWQVLIAIVIILLLMWSNLRGARASARFVAGPVYLFVVSVGILVLVGSVEAMTGTLGQAQTAARTQATGAMGDATLTAFGSALLIVRAFASGCVSAGGLKAIANGVPAFRPPRATNARLTLLWAGVTSAVLLLGIVWLASATKVSVVSSVAEDSHAFRVPVLGQIAQVVFGAESFAFFWITVLAALVLFFAANSAFGGFPFLAAVLAKNAYVPRQFAVRGDRLAYSNGVLALAAAAVVVVWATGADVSFLIHLYVVGVFVSYAIGQVGLYRHYGARLRVSIVSAERAMLRSKRRVTFAAAVVLSTVLMLIAISKFLAGAWITLLAIGLLVATMRLTFGYYERIAREIELPTEGKQYKFKGARAVTTKGHAPSHGVVLVTKLNRPAMRALCAADAAGHVSLQAVTVHIDDRVIDQLQEAWDRHRVPIALRVIYSPYREALGPVLEFVRSLTRLHPRDEVVVYIPEFIVGHWWQAPLHNAILRRMRHRFAHLDRVTIRTVPWRLGAEGPAVGPALSKRRVTH